MALTVSDCLSVKSYMILLFLPLVELDEHVDHHLQVVFQNMLSPLSSESLIFLWLMPSFSLPNIDMSSSVAVPANPLRRRRHVHFRPLRPLVRLPLPLSKNWLHLYYIFISTTKTAPGTATPPLWVAGNSWTPSISFTHPGSSS